MFNWFRNKNTDEMKYLIVGLGNIGEEYQSTRHNIGFDVLDKFAGLYDAKFEVGRLAFVAKTKYRGKSLVLIKPTTYMNLSGKALKHWMSTEKVALHNVLVVADDLALPLGKIRLKTKGSHAGHNGLRDIISQLGTDQFSRIKFGIGNDFPRGRQVEFVLGKWSEQELIDLNEGVDRSIEIINSFIVQGAERTMNEFN